MAAASPRQTTTDRHLAAGCFDCGGVEAMWTTPNAQALAARHHDATGHATWCDVRMEILYGVRRPDPRQHELEDAIASSSGGAPEAAPLPDFDAPAAAPADVSAANGRPVETRGLMPRDARGRKPETIHAHP